MTSFQNASKVQNDIFKMLQMFKMTFFQNASNVQNDTDLLYVTDHLKMLTFKMWQSMSCLNIQQAFGLTSV